MGGWRRETMDAAMDNLQKIFNMTILNIQVVYACTKIRGIFPNTRYNIL